MQAQWETSEVSLWACDMIGLDVSRILDNRGLNFRYPGGLEFLEGNLAFFSQCWGPGWAGRQRRVLRGPLTDLLPVFPSRSAPVSPVLTPFLPQSNLVFNAFSELSTSTISSLFQTVNWFGKRFPNANFLLHEVRFLFAFNPGQLEGWLG